MILKAKHNFFIYPFFKCYAGWIIKRHFGTINIYGELNNKTLPILLISNHVSWWDGFWAEYINKCLFHRRIYFMMLEEQLRKYWIFNFTGGYSVKKKSRSVLETIRYTRELLNDNNNMVLIFPQGEIQSLYNQNVSFESGLERILRDKENKVQVVFIVNFIDYFSCRKPGIYFYLQECSCKTFDKQSIQESYTLFYNQSLEKQRNLKSNK